MWDKKLQYLLICSIFFSVLKANSSNLFSLNPNNFPERIEKYDTLDSTYKELYHIIDSLNIGTLKKSFNGSILVGYKGKVLYQNSFGLADKSNQEENTPSTPTQLASITKTFTSSAILKLHEQGLINIYDPVINYIPEFLYLDITIEQLLSHRSGLPDYLNFSGKYWNSSEPMYNNDVLEMFVQYNFPLRFTPGKKFEYCNTNYALLGLLIERISGEEYKKFMKNNLFDPLHMDCTYVYDPVVYQPYASAKSYKNNFTNWKNTHQDGVYADKGIFSTVEDLYRWDQALQTNEFLSQETQQEAYTPRSPWYVKKNYGLGWRIKCYPNQKKYVYHTGWWHGYQGIFSRYLNDDFTIIILSNRFTSGISANAEKIYAACQPILELTELK